MHPAATKFTPFARLAWQASGYIIAAGVFLAAYIDWRPAAILFTFSDLLFIVGAVALCHYGPWVTQQHTGTLRFR